MAALLEYEGWTVVTAMNGLDALRHALAGRPDIVLLDHRLPDVGGRKLCDTLREAGFEQPVVLVTGAELDAAAPERAVHVLEKPFEIEELFAILERALGGA